jgi:hypothetical protein
MYKFESISRYILNEVETCHHLISIRLYFILTILITEDDHNHMLFNNCNSAGFLFFNLQVWTQKCAVQKSSVDVNISYY